MGRRLGPMQFRTAMHEMKRERLALKGRPAPGSEEWKTAVADAIAKPPRARSSWETAQIAIASAQWESEHARKH
jgi:hypothetical protein